MPRVFVTREIAPEAIEMLRAKAEVKVWNEDRAIPRDVLLREVADTDALLSLLTEKIDGELLDAGKRLKIVANMAVGFDNFDVPALTQRGIVGTNTPGVLTDLVGILLMFPPTRFLFRRWLIAWFKRNFKIQTLVPGPRPGGDEVVDSYATDSSEAVESRRLP